MKRFAKIALAIFTTFAGHGCETARTNTIGNPPVPIEVLTQRILLAAHLGQHRLLRFNIRVSWDDMYYHVATEEEFEEIKKWWKQFKTDNNFFYKEENPDCDNFAHIFKYLLNMHGGNHEFAVGTVIVGVGHVRSLGIRPSGKTKHILNIIPVRNEKTIEWYIFEPQTDLYELLRSYPNQIHIEKISF